MATNSLIKVAFATIALCGLISAAGAQYVWCDEKGTKQFSDMPPPASVPKKNILKSPDPATPRQGQSAPGANGATLPPAAAANAPMSIAEKNADFNRRKIEQAEKDKKTSDQAKLDAEKAKNCERARAYKRVLDSGELIGQIDKNGERGFMSDEQRAQDTKEMNTFLDECKS